MKHIVCSIATLLLFATEIFAIEDSSQSRSSSPKSFKNSLVLSGTDYTLFTTSYLPRRGILGPLLFWRDEQIGIYYHRTISKRWGVTLGYNMWNNTPLYYDHPGQFMTSQSREIRVRSIIWSTCYKTADAFINYQIFKIGNQQVKLAFGVCYTRGLNEIVDSIVVLPGYFDAEIFTHSDKASYFGITPNLSYDYLILRNRISIGFDIRYRKYFGFYYEGFETGCHLGVNF